MKVIRIYETSKNTFAQMTNVNNLLLCKCENQRQKKSLLCHLSHYAIFNFSREQNLHIRII